MPADLPAAVLIVLHVPAHGTSVLPAILSRVGKLPATHAREGQPIEMGHIYIAPPDHHLIVKKGSISLTSGPHENRHRPAIDPLFRAAAREYGSAVIGVVLSGVLDDGTAGLLAIKMRGGITVVQDPDDAMYRGMPVSAIEHVNPAHIVRASEMAPLLTRLSYQPVNPHSGQPVTEQLEIEAEITELDIQALQEHEHMNKPSEFVCPDCGGTLYELSDDKLLRFRCRVGHAYSPQTLFAGQSEQLEAAFWVALRKLEETAALADKLASRARQTGSYRSAERFEAEAKSVREQAELIRATLLNGWLSQFSAERNIDTLDES